MDAKKIKQYFEDAGEQVRSYSGREMYGKECLGVETSDPIACILAAVETAWDALGAEGSQCVNAEPFREFLYELRNSRQDSMGLSTILYFPEIAWEEGEQEKQVPACDNCPFWQRGAQEGMPCEEGGTCTEHNMASEAWQVCSLHPKNKKKWKIP